MIFDYMAYLILVLAVLGLLAASMRVLREYERGIVFTLGRFTGVKGPGLIILIPFVQQMVRADLRLVVQDVPPQDVISRDNVSVKVSAVLYFRIVDPERAIIKVENFMAATRPPCALSSANMSWMRCWPSATGSTRTFSRSWISRPMPGASR
jgi:regulator of protease activity HflC (stomatin/prohibitin superfamily)